MFSLRLLLILSIDYREVVFLGFQLIPFMANNAFVATLLQRAYRYVLSKGKIQEPYFGL